MKLKKWLKYVDPIIDVKIFESGAPDDEPAFKGPAFNIPWSLVEREIGRTKEDKEEPIYICSHVNDYGTELPLIVINII